MSDHDILNNLDKKLTAILAILINLSKDGDKRDREELLLANLGFTARDISLVVNKNLTAVQKSIQRAKK